MYVCIFINSIVIIFKCPDWALVQNAHWWTDLCTVELKWWQRSVLSIFEKKKLWNHLDLPPVFKACPLHTQIESSSLPTRRWKTVLSSSVMTPSVGCAVTLELRWCRSPAPVASCMDPTPRDQRWPRWLKLCWEQRRGGWRYASTPKMVWSCEFVSFMPVIESTQSQHITSKPVQLKMYKGGRWHELITKVVIVAKRSRLTSMKFSYG